MKKQKVAIIGTGISGLTCAHLLHPHHAITVFEANDYIGGHTATKKVTIESTQYNIDTGFIVFNDWTYPNFIKLMDKLQVARQPCEMSFSVHAKQSDIEYNGNTLNTLFAQRRNLFRPRFWRIVKDILTFNKSCKKLVASNADVADKTLYGYIQELKLSGDFANFYILPMCAAIWSASIEQTRQFPLQFFLTFFNNHGLLNVNNRPQWYTLKGGSSSYISSLIKGFEARIHTQTPVKNVVRINSGWLITSKRGEEQFDAVIFACHSDQALQLLESATSAQQEILSAIPYAQNEVVMHTDTNQLPQRKRAWASWNYQLTEQHDEAAAPAAVTYNMNILQCIENAPVTFCVSLNNTANIDKSSILGEYRYAHPQFSHNMVRAQQRRGEICGVNNLHFCGAYWYNGFHEDGVNSAMDVARRFGIEL
ncbi:NAD(P)/FAD-dependent oxidoreductase [Alteromonas lipotrueiana]|uniref:NAD(P)/FAD-dependent oxidoreductase n=1 Tax=Alteromonas lipotrueiana TaxID=2803815 RepID=UPI001C44507D|nr:FAD-dependent oxidoreductase [Alteromonas lipotrueiana]